ncbi:MAG: DNA glycosylase [Candidatus Bathyarchaeia archaeon]
MEITLNQETPFNLDITLCCGQAFRWIRHGEWWYGVIGEKAFKIRQNCERLEFENVDEKFVRNYFGLNDDLQYIYRKVCKDEHVKNAIEASKGLRIIRQEPWECLISYICATYKNIPAIQKMLEALSRKFGEKICFDGMEFYTFPTKEKIASASIRELEECGLGYRAKYVYETAKAIREANFDFEQLKKISYERAKSELLRFPGIGCKVADCVLLFSLEKFEAFPVDVWMRRAILKFYAHHFPKDFVAKLSSKKSLTPSMYNVLNLFGRKYFGDYAGYAQEYLYHYVKTLD